jgi:hypothetical protein
MVRQEELVPLRGHLIRIRQQIDLQNLLQIVRALQIGVGQRAPIANASRTAWSPKQRRTLSTSE